MAALALFFLAFAYVGWKLLELALKLALLVVVVIVSVALVALRSLRS